MITKEEIFRNLQELINAEWNDDTQNEIIVAFENYGEIDGQTFIRISDLNMETTIDDIKCKQFQAYAENKEDKGFLIFVDQKDNKIIKIEEL